MILLPFNSYGDRIITVNTGLHLLEFRTYYQDTDNGSWLLDISHEENSLLTGIAIRPGATDLLRGQTGILFDYQLYCLDETKKSTDRTNALGATITCVLYLPGESNIVGVKDVLLDIPKPAFGEVKGASFRAIY